MNLKGYHRMACQMGHGKNISSVQCLRESLGSSIYILEVQEVRKEKYVSLQLL